MIYSALVIGGINSWIIYLTAEPDKLWLSPACFVLTVMWGIICKYAFGGKK